MDNVTQRLDDSVRRKIFYNALRIRMVEEEIAKHYPQGQMRCPTHLSIGQEAAPVVVCHGLTAEDLAVSSHRSHAHYLSKGGRLRELIAELYGKKTGCTQGRGGSMNLSDLSAGFVASKAIVGHTIPIGVGLALAQKLKKSRAITCIFLGDAAVEEGAFYESLNFAVLEKLPVLFMCENNLYSVNSHIDLRQPKGRAIFNLAQGIGAKAVQFHGSEPFSYFDKMQNMIEDLRHPGQGPWFVEFLTYRYKVHCGHEDDIDPQYRPKEELDYWLSQDPIILMENQLTSSSVLTLDEIAQYRFEIQREIEDAFLFAEQSPFPDAAESFKQKFSEKNNADWLRAILSKEHKDVTLEH